MSNSAATTAKREDKLRKLFAKAHDSAVTEHERDALLASIAKLITQWDLEDADLSAAAPQPAATEIVSRQYPVCMGRANIGAAILAEGLSRVFGCTTLYTVKRWTPVAEERFPGVRFTAGYAAGDGRSKFILLTAYGTAANLSRWGAWMDFLLPQLKVDIARENPPSPKAFASYWSTSVITRARKMFGVERSTAQAAAAGVEQTYALAVRDAESVMREQHPHLGAGDRVYISSDAERASARSGRANGSSAQLPGRGVAGGAAGALTS